MINELGFTTDVNRVLLVCSLLVVDTVQDLGSSYELLLASSRSVRMELDSGNILDSGLASPCALPQCSAGVTATASGSCFAVAVWELFV